MRFLRAELALSALAVLAGCAVGPDYRQPKVELPPAFANAGPAGHSARAAPDLWWRSLGDDDLNTLIAEGIGRNYDLQGALANLREARALYLEAGLNLAPIITTHANYTDQKRSVGSLNNRNFVPRGLKLYNAGFDAFWEVDFFGRVRRDLEAGIADAQAQEATFQDLTVSVIGEIARNYFELRGLQNQLAVAGKNADNQAETLRITRARVEYGRGTELDSSRAEAQLKTTLANIPPLEASIRQAIHRLSVLTGRPPAALTSRLSQPKPLLKKSGPLAVGNPEQLLRRRPDIRMAERTLAASTARIGVATADLFPRVTFVGTLALEASTLSGLGAAGADTYSAGPRISWAALDLGRVYARIRAADANAEADLARYRQTVLNALEETENALVSYNREQQRRTLLAAAAEASEKAQKLARLRFEKGVSDFLTVLDAESRLFQDQIQLAQSETAAATALIGVYKALGAGWQTTAQIR